MTTDATSTPEAGGSQVERWVMQHTRGPWRVVVDEHPHRAGGKHVERRIFTEWDHPQLKGPIGVVNMSVGLGTHDQAARHFVSLSAADAALIATAPEMLECLRAVEVLFAPHCKDSTQADWLGRTQALLRRLGAA